MQSSVALPEHFSPSGLN